MRHWWFAFRMTSIFTLNTLNLNFIVFLFIRYFWFLKFYKNCNHRVFVNVNHIFLLKYYFYNELLEINEENTTQKETGQRWTGSSQTENPRCLQEPCDKMPNFSRWRIVRKMWNYLNHKIPFHTCQFGKTFKSLMRTRHQTLVVGQGVGSSLQVAESRHVSLLEAWQMPSSLCFIF